MRKHTMAIGAALALSLGGAGIAAAQSAPSSPRQNAGVEQHERGPGEHRGERGGRLLQGITLSSAQKARLDDMRKAERAEMEKHRDAMRSTFDQARAARQRGDTASARSIMERARGEMERSREQRVAAIRAVLTPEQQHQFDANVAEWKQHANDRQEHRGQGGRDGQGGRGARQHGDSAPNRG